MPTSLLAKTLFFTNEKTENSDRTSIGESALSFFVRPTAIGEACTTNTRQTLSDVLRQAFDPLRYYLNGAFGPNERIPKLLWRRDKVISVSY